MELHAMYLDKAARIGGVTDLLLAFVLDLTDATRTHDQGFFSSVGIPILGQAVARDDRIVIPIPDTHMTAAFMAIGRDFHRAISLKSFGTGGGVVYIFQ